MDANTAGTAHDRSNMAARVAALPQQLRSAWDLAESGPDLMAGTGAARVYVCAMGGSAIGGDFVRAHAARHGDVPVEVVRGYELPRAVNGDAFAFFVSYSGNTEETLSGWTQASRRGVPRAAVTSGGRLAELAEAEGVPCLRIPPGSPPRAALGWTSLPIFAAMARAGRLEFGRRDVEDAADACARVIDRHGPGAGAADPLRRWSEACAERLPVIYAPAEPYAPCALRWANQLNENAKILAHVGLFPEHNHNEIVAWDVPSPLHRLPVVAFLGGRAAHPRVRRRMEVVAREISRAGGTVAAFEPEGETTAGRLYSLASLGDLASLYLAAVRGLDPTPVEGIDRLKKELGGLAPEEEA